MSGWGRRPSGQELSTHGYSVMQHWKAMPSTGAYKELIDCVGVTAHPAADGRDPMLTSSGVMLEEPAADGRWAKIERLQGAGCFEEITTALRLLVSELMGEPYVLFKDKINNKRPGLGH